MNATNSLLLGALVALGLAAAGYFIGNGFVEARALERSVEVKGLAEREVPADTAIWPLTFVVAGNELDTLLEQVEDQGGQVRAFLTLRGFEDQEISTSVALVTDRQAQGMMGQERLQRSCG